VLGTTIGVNFFGKVGTHMASVEHKPIAELAGAEPQQAPGVEPLVKQGLRSP